MKKTKIGIVTTWGDCGMGYIAKNWIYTIEKFPELFEHQIFSRAVKKFTPFRWYGQNIIQGPESMDINHSIFWEWIENFKPDVILFQDQNRYSNSKMVDESEKLKKIGIKLINYPDWIYRDDLQNYRGLYDINLAHVNRNYKWLQENNLESPVLIKWGVILKNFPFIQRKVGDKIKFYTNLGSGSERKGYQYIPKALKKLQGDTIFRIFHRPKKQYSFLFSSQEKSEIYINKRFLKEIKKNPQCELIYKTANNLEGGLFSLGDVYIYPTAMEGVGLTITEALATGMPVVTTDYSTMNDWFEDRKEGRLIKVKKIKQTPMAIKKVYPDINHLAEIMEYYIDQPEIVQEHSFNARQRIELEFNWDDRDSEILALFDL